MTGFYQRFVRRMAPTLAAGYLFQTTGCTVTGEEIAQGLISAILNNLITSLIFGLFNVPFV
jgi:hypothetical protein